MNSCDCDILAHADFHVFGNGFDNRPVDYTVHAELYKSEAYAYGNGTGMSFEWSNGNVDTFDTRYENVSVENFTEFAENALKNYVFPTLHVEIKNPCLFCEERKLSPDVKYAYTNIACNNGFGICKALLDYQKKVSEKNTSERKIE